MLSGASSLLRRDSLGISSLRRRGISSHFNFLSNSFVFKLSSSILLSSLLDDESDLLDAVV